MISRDIGFATALGISLLYYMVLESYSIEQMVVWFYIGGSIILLFSAYFGRFVGRYLVRHTSAKYCTNCGVTTFEDVYCPACDYSTLEGDSS